MPRGRGGQARPPDLCDPDVVRRVARQAGVVARRRFGQNFLVDRSVLDDMVRHIDPGATDDVVEIGPGLGVLTLALAERAGRVVAVEIDPACLRATRMSLGPATNVDLVAADALRFDPRGYVGTDFIAAGNIPYNITTPLLSHLFELEMPPRRGVFLVQREVAQRLAAAPGDWSLATVAIRSIAAVDVVRVVPPSSFMPAPAVHSAIIIMRPEFVLTVSERRAVLDLARSAFQLRRKTLRHGMTRALAGDASAAESALARAGIDARRRPETLTLAEWRTLAVAAGRVVG